MIGSWMLSALAIGVLLGVGTLCVAAFGRSLGAARRWLWFTAMLLSLTLPVGLATRARATLDPLPATAMNTTTTARSTTLVAPLRTAKQQLDYDPLLLLGWGLMSLTLAALLGASHRRSLTLLRTWQASQLHGAAVVISPDFGPAAVGLIRSQIVVPDWVMGLSDEEQRLVLRHELEHIRAGDQFVLLVGVALAVLMPWNVALWWQLRRLRIAIELDCDARVAPDLRDRPRYASLLLRARAPRGADQMALAFFPTRSALGARLEALLDRARPTRRQQTIWSLSAAACLGVLVHVPVPALNTLLPHASTPASPIGVSAGPVTTAAAFSLRGGFVAPAAVAPSHRTSVAARTRPTSPYRPVPRDSIGPRHSHLLDSLLPIDAAKLPLCSTCAPAPAMGVGRPAAPSGGVALPPVPAARVRYDLLLPIDSAALSRQGAARGARRVCTGCAKAVGPDSSAVMIRR